MLGELIKKYCNESNISQDKFGELIGVSARYVRYLIAGTQEPSVDMARKIQHLLNCSMDEIYNKKAG